MLPGGNSREGTKSSCEHNTVEIRSLEGRCSEKHKQELWLKELELVKLP